MKCDRRTFVKASAAAGMAAVGTTGANVARAQENGSGNQSGNGTQTAGNATQTATPGGNTTGTASNGTQATTQAATTTAGNGTQGTTEAGGNASGGEGGNQSGNASGGEGGEGGEGGAEGSSEPAIDMQSLTLIFGAAVMAALSPLIFGALLLLRGRGGHDESTSAGKRYDGR